MQKMNTAGMRTWLALPSPLLTVPQPGWQHVSSLSLGVFRDLDALRGSLFGPVWGQKQGLLTLYLGVN